MRQQDHCSLSLPARAFALLFLAACTRQNAAPDAASNAPPPARSSPPPPAVDAAPARDLAPPPAPPDAAAPDAAPDAAVDARPAAPGAVVQGPWEAEQDALLHRLCDGEVERIERNRGGSTLSFRVWFAGGARGLFKPQQQASVANFRAEIAAYRLARLLGIHRVPPACGRTLPRARLQQAADASGDEAFGQRAMHELLGRGDNVPGAMLYWVPGPLENVPEADHWQQWLDGSQPLTPALEPVAADMARLLLFDFLTDNVDRWSGGNVLRQHLAQQPPGPVLFMDNGASFTVGEGGLGGRPREQAERLSHVRRLPRSMVDAVQALTLERLTAAMAADPLGSALGPAQLQAVLSRRARLLTHVNALAAVQGDQALVFP